MRLIRYEITNFGRLSDFKGEFDGKLSEFMQDNAWGKSTMATFLRVMFYGFKNESGKSIATREREKLRPWNGKTYAGSLVFEVNNKKYLLSAKWGRKVSEDEYTLLNADTLLPTDDYSAYPLGEELFGLDMASFERTIFIAQNDVVLEGAATDGINAKIGKLTEDTSDVNSYQEVIEAFKARINELSPTKANGKKSIKALKMEIDALCSEVKKETMLDQSLEAQQKQLASQKEVLEALQKKAQALDTEYDESCKRDANRITMQTYEDKKQGAADAKQHAQELRAGFPMEVPTLEDMDRALELIAEKNAAKTSADSRMLTEEKEEKRKQLAAQFADGIPMEEDLVRMSAQVDEMAALRRQAEKGKLSGEEQKRWKELSERYPKAVPSTGELTTAEDAVKTIQKQEEIVRDRTFLLETLRHKVESGLLIERMESRRKREEEERAAEEARRFAMENLHREKTRKKSILFMALLLLIAGVVLIAVAKMIPVGVVVIGIGVLAAGFSFTVVKTKVPEPVEAQKDGTEGATAESGILPDEIDADPEIQKNLEGIAKAKEEMELGRDHVLTLLARYGYTNPETMKEDLRTLRDDSENYANLKRRIEEQNAAGAEENAEAILRSLTVDLNRFYPGLVITADNVSAQVVRLQGDVAEYQALKDTHHRVREDREREAEKDRLLKELLARFGLPGDADTEPEIRALRDRIKEYLDAATAAEEKAELLAKVEAELDLEALSKSLATECRDSETVRLERVANAEAIREQENLIKQIHAAATELAEQYEELQEKSAELEAAQEKLAGREKTYQLLTNTADLLRQAKENLVNKYTRPIQEGYEKYYGLLTGEKADRFCVDANLQVKLQEEGALREVKSLSSGLQDLTGLCLRLAMVDAMYENEKPFLIMDDPFVNLDGKKLANMKAFLQKVSEEYQIVYFTCHESRAYRSKS